MTVANIANLLADRNFCKAHGRVWEDGRSCLYFHVDDPKLSIKEVQVNSWEFDSLQFPDHEGKDYILGYCNYPYDIDTTFLTLSDYATYEKHRRENEAYIEGQMSYISFSHNWD